MMICDIYIYKYDSNAVYAGVKFPTKITCHVVKGSSPCSARHWDTTAQLRMGIDHLRTQLNIHIYIEPILHQ